MKKAQRLFQWADGKSLEIGRRTLVMGILNLTPDSFADGGKWYSPEKALAHAKKMVAEGADLIDVGAESTRPGFQALSAEEEIARLSEVLPALLREITVPVSLDTYKAETAAYAAAQGVHILNDICGLQYAAEPGRMAEVAAEYQLPVIVMHNQPQGAGQGNIISSMKKYFRHTCELAVQLGIKRENLIFDPGIGFGKTVQENLTIVARLAELAELDGAAYPLLLGTSRKSFIGETLGLPVEERLEGTGATCVLGITQGCSIVRVHDVKAISRMCKMTDAILEAGRDGA